MMRDVAEILGLVCFVVFAFFVWVPLTFLALGFILFFGAHSYKTNSVGREVHYTGDTK